MTEVPHQKQIEKVWVRPLVGVTLLIFIVSMVSLLNTKALSIFFAIIILYAAWEWARLAGKSKWFIWIYCWTTLILLLWLLAGSSITTEKVFQGILYFTIFLWFLIFIFICIYNSAMSQQAWLTYFFIIAGIPIVISTWRISYSLETWPLLYVLAIVVTTDTVAYYSGRYWGGKKLAPDLSPGKTMAGLWGAVIGVLVLSTVVSYWRLQLHDSWLQFFEFILLSLVICFVCVIGDLGVSMLKRCAGKKDSGGLLPGNGGLLDRLDSVLAALPIFWILQP